MQLWTRAWRQAPLARYFPFQVARRRGGNDVIRTKDTLRKRNVLSVALEIPHPLGPVARLDPAGLAPGAVYGEPPMLLQRPQLLEPHTPDRPIREEHIGSGLVPVAAIWRQTACPGRFVSIPRQLPRKEAVCA